MQDTLNPFEIRVIGCLIEKSVVTPDLYPLTLNALTNACNQKSSRAPVMNLSPGDVQKTIRVLETKHLVRTEENFKNRTEKYSQRFCGTRYSGLQFDPAQIAIVCLLLLRGPQTPGEIRARSGRLHVFANNDAVVISLQSLIDRDGEALLMKLPRTPGRKDAEYMHLFSGPIDIDEYTDGLPTKQAGSGAESAGTESLVQRIERLEAEVADLKKRLL